MELQEGLGPNRFELFRDWIHQHSGIFLEHSKADALQLSLEHRATVCGADDLDAYFEILTGDEDEFKELMNLVTINETSFFRFPGQFEALREVVVPEILTARDRQAGAAAAQDLRPFRVWSAGCSTGEEPYTIAMTLLDSELGTRGVPIEVIGTDVSTRALDRAVAAVYTPRAIESVDEVLVARYFEPLIVPPESDRPDIPNEQGEPTVPISAPDRRPTEPVRALCEFRYHNLIRDPFAPLPFSGLDVIFCRNVMIYFQLATTRRVISRFFDALNPGGYLFLGHSETLSASSDRFETVDACGVFLYRKPLAVTPPAEQNRASLTPPGAALHPGRPPRARIVAGAALATASAFEPTSPAPRAAMLASASPATPAPATGDADAVRLAAAFARADVGDLKGAAAEAAEILELQPLCAPARFLLGVCRRGQGDSDGALVEFRRTLYIDPEFCLAHFALAGLYQGRGEPAEAIREFERALDLLGERREGSWSVFLGGFSPEVIAQACERGIAESVKALHMPKEAARTGRY